MRVRHDILDRMMKTTVILQKDKYIALREKLVRRGLSFSAWVRLAIEKEIASDFPPRNRV